MESRTPSVFRAWMQFHQRISGSTCVASIRSFQVKYFCRRSWLTSSHQRTYLRRALRADTTSASIPRLLPATGRRLAEVRFKFGTITRHIAQSEVITGSRSTTTRKDIGHPNCTYLSFTQSSPFHH